jgi:hypothetical protein
VVLVSRDNMLAGALRSLIEAPGGVRMLDWHSDELDSAIRRADVVVVDVPQSLHAGTFDVIDGRFLGRTVVLLQEGERAEALPPGPPRAILFRPLQIAELWAAVTGAAPDEASGLGVGVTDTGADAGVAASGGAVAAEDRPGGDDDHPGPASESAGTADAGPADAGDQAAAVQGPGLPVSESGLLIGLSGRELEPVVGPGQVAPGMDEETFERLRRWGTRGRQPAPGTSGKVTPRRAAGTRAGRAKSASAEARRQRVAKAEAKAATREETARQRAARAEARTAAREQARQTRQAERQAAEEASRQTREARTAEKTAAQQRARLSKAAEAEARKVTDEHARKAKAAQAAEQAATREQSRQAKAAEAEAHKAAREEARNVKAAEAEALKAAQEEARQVKAAEAAARKAAEDEARKVKAAEAEAVRAAEEQARQAKAAEAAEQAAAREEVRKAEAAAQAVERAAAREAARQEKAARVEARNAARAEATRERAAEAEVRKAAQAEARQLKATQAEARQVARAAARQEQSAQAAARRAARLEARQAKAVETRARRAESAEARRAAWEETRRAWAARFAAWKVARAEASQARATRRAEARQVRQAKAEVNRTARARARQERAVATQARQEQSRQAQAAQAQARQAAREQASQAKAARAEEQRTAREAAAQVKAAETEAKREQASQAKAAQAVRRAAEQEAASQAKAAKAVERAAAQEQARQAKAARAEKREVARAAQAEATEAARAEASRERAVQAEAQQAARAAKAEARRTVREEADRVKAARAEARAAEAAAKQAARDEVGGARGVGLGSWVERFVQPALVVVVLAVVAVAAAGWRMDGGPDTRAGEVAVVRAAGGAGGGLVAQDPRVGPISPLHALAEGTWLRMTGTTASLEGTVREARVPGRFLLALVVALTVVLFLRLIRVGPGTGAAAGPGPAPPQRWEGASRIGGAALAGVLVALDPLLVQNAREATGTILALVLALGALALAWSVPERPTVRWLPPVVALGGLALLASPLALPVLAVPVAADLLGGRHREAWRSMAALALGIGVWLLLPLWVAGQDLGSGQAGWLLGRPPGQGSVAASLTGTPLSWLLVAAGLAAAILAWRHRSGARPQEPAGSNQQLAWVATTVAGALVAAALGYPASQAIAFATPAAAVALALACVHVLGVAGTGGTRGTTRRLVLAATAVALAGLVVAQGVDWSSRYGRPADDGLGKLVATVAAQVPGCSAVNASGPDDRARLLAAGVTVTEFSDGQAAAAAGVRYFVLTGATAGGGPLTPSLAAWVRERGNRLAAYPSRSLSGVELWRIDPAPLDPMADSLPVPDGMYSNVTGSACGGYRVVDSQLGSFYTAYRAAGGKAVLGRPLGSVWTTDGPALQAFDTMVLGAVPSGSGPPAVKPIELPPLLAKLDVEAVADADIPLPSTRPPVTDRQAMALLGDEMIARAYLGTDPATATPEDWRRARDRFGRPLGTPQTMPDGAVRQPFEKAVLELPADGGPARPAALGRLAVRLGLVPKQAMRPEPVPGLPARPAETRLDTGPLVRSLGLVLALLALAAGAGVVAAARPRSNRPEEAVPDR